MSSCSIPNRAVRSIADMTGKHPEEVNAICDIINDMIGDNADVAIGITDISDLKAVVEGVNNMFMDKDIASANAIKKAISDEISKHKDINPIKIISAAIEQDARAKYLKETAKFSFIDSHNNREDESNWSESENVETFINGFLDGKRDGNLLDFIRNIAGFNEIHSNNGMYDSVISLLEKINNGTGVKIAFRRRDENAPFAMKRGRKGYYNPTTKTIYINQDFDFKNGVNANGYRYSQLVETIFHEAVHAITSNLLQNKETKAKGEALLSKIKEIAAENGISTEDYGFKDIDEALSELMTNSFYDKLNSIKIPVENKLNFIQRVKNAILGFFANAFGISMANKTSGSNQRLWDFFREIVDTEGNFGDVSSVAPLRNYYQEESNITSIEKAENIIEGWEAYTKEHITFDSDKHEYYIDGTKVDTSVTQYENVLFGEPQIKGNYDFASIIGTAVDELTRDFYDKGEDYVRKTTYPNISEEHKEALMSDFKALKGYMDGRFPNGYKVITKEFPLAARVTDSNGTKTMAGTMDMLVIESDGTAHIFDMKAKNRKGFAFNDGGKYTYQLNTYKQILEDVLGFKGKVGSLQLIWFAQNYPSPEKIKYKIDDKKTIYVTEDVNLSEDKQKWIPMSEYTGWTKPSLTADNKRIGESIKVLPVEPHFDKVEPINDSWQDYVKDKSELASTTVDLSTDKDTLLANTQNVKTKGLVSAIDETHPDTVGPYYMTVDAKNGYVLRFDSDGIYEHTEATRPKNHDQNTYLYKLTYDADGHIVHTRLSDKEFKAIQPSIQNGIDSALEKIKNSKPSNIATNDEEVQSAYNALSAAIAGYNNSTKVVYVSSDAENTKTYKVSSESNKSKELKEQLTAIAKNGKAEKDVALTLPVADFKGIKVFDKIYFESRNGMIVTFQAMADGQYTLDGNITVVGNVDVIATNNFDIANAKFFEDVTSEKITKQVKEETFISKINNVKNKLGPKVYEDRRRLVSDDFAALVTSTGVSSLKEDMMKDLESRKSEMNPYDVQSELAYIDTIGTTDALNTFGKAHFFNELKSEYERRINVLNNIANGNLFLNNGEIDENAYKGIYSLLRPVKSKGVYKHTETQKNYAKKMAAKYEALIAQDVWDVITQDSIEQISEKLGVKMSLREDTATKINKDEMKDAEEEASDLGKPSTDMEEKTVESWQEEQSAKGKHSSLTVELKHELSNIQEYDDNGKPKVDDLGNPIYMDEEVAFAFLQSRLGQCLTMDEMQNEFEDMILSRKQYTGLFDKIKKDENNRCKNPNLRAAFYRAMKTQYKNIFATKQGKEQRRVGDGVEYVDSVVTFQINKVIAYRYMTDSAMSNIENGDILNTDSSIYDKDLKVKKKNVESAIERLKGVIDRVLENAYGVDLKQSTSAFWAKISNYSRENVLDVINGKETIKVYGKGKNKNTFTEVNVEDEPFLKEVANIYNVAYDTVTGLGFEITKNDVLDLIYTKKNKLFGDEGLFTILLNMLEDKSLFNTTSSGSIKMPMNNEDFKRNMIAIAKTMNAIGKNAIEKSTRENGKVVMSTTNTSYESEMKDNIKQDDDEKALAYINEEFNQYSWFNMKGNEEKLRKMAQNTFEHSFTPRQKTLLGTAYRNLFSGFKDANNPSKRIAKPGELLNNLKEFVRVYNLCCEQYASDGFNKGELETIMGGRVPAVYTEDKKLNALLREFEKNSTYRKGFDLYTLNHFNGKEYDDWSLAEYASVMMMNYYKERYTLKDGWTKNQYISIANPVLSDSPAAEFWRIKRRTKDDVNNLGFTLTQEQKDEYAALVYGTKADGKPYRFADLTENQGGSLVAMLEMTNIVQQEINRIGNVLQRDAMRTKAKEQYKKGNGALQKAEKERFEAEMTEYMRLKKSIEESSLSPEEKANELAAIEEARKPQPMKVYKSVKEEVDENGNLLWTEPDAYYDITRKSDGSIKNIGGAEFKFFPALNDVKITVGDTQMSFLKYITDLISSDGNIDLSNPTEGKPDIRDVVFREIVKIQKSGFEEAYSKWIQNGVFDTEFDYKTKTTNFKHFEANVPFQTKADEIDAKYLKESGNSSILMQTYNRTLKDEKGNKLQGDALAKAINDNIDLFKSNSHTDEEFEKLFESAKKDALATNGSFNKLYNLMKEHFKEIADKEKSENVNQLSDATKEILMEYYNQSCLGTALIEELTITDLAYYKNPNDFQKRYKEVYAPSERLCTDVPFGKEIETSLYIKDVEMASPDEMIENIKKILKAAGMKASEINDIASSFKRNNVVDAQAYRSPKAYRAVKAMAGDLSIEEKVVLSRIIGDLDYVVANVLTEEELEECKEKGISLESYPKITKDSSEADRKKFKDMIAKDSMHVFQTIKPFTYAQIGMDSGVESYGNIKIGTQHKNSEFALFWATEIGRHYADILGLAEDNNIKKLVSLGEFMDEHDIDLVQFHSAVKVGCYGVVDTEGYQEGDDFKKYLERQVYKYDESTGFVDYKQELPGIIKRIPYKNYGIQASTPEHLIDIEQLVGSQIRRLILADNNAKTPFYINGKEYTRQQLIDHYNALITENIIESLSDLDEMFSSPENIEELLLKEMQGNSQYTSDMMKAARLVTLEDGRKVFPLLCDPVVSKKIEALLNSIIKNRITKQKIKGGACIQVSCFGCEDLKVTWSEPDENGVRHPLEMECYMGAYSKDLFEPAMDKNGILDLNVLKNNVDKKTFDAITHAIGYRVPTEDKYSMARLKIKGFLPPINGSAIMLPKEITTLSGSDFDVDKMYLMLHEFKKTKRARFKNLGGTTAFVNKINSLFADKEALAFMKENGLAKGMEIDDVIKLFDTIGKSIEEYRQTEQQKGSRLSEWIKKKNGKDAFTKFMNYSSDIMTWAKKNSEKVKNGKVNAIAKELSDFIDKSSGIEVVNTVKVINYRNTKEEFNGEDALEQKLYYAKEARENNRAARNNEIIDVMQGIMSHPDTASKFLNPGSFDIQKKTARMIEIITGNDEETLKTTFNVNNINKLYDVMSKMSLDDLEDVAKKLRGRINPLSPYTQVYFHNQNEIGGKLIGAYANHNAAHAAAQYFNLNISQRGQFLFNGKIKTSLHDTDPRISKNNAGFLAASVDNVKDPVLYWLNQNLYTADVSMLLARAGYSADEIGLLMNQPVIKKATDNFANGSYGSKDRIFGNAVKEYFNLDLEVGNVLKVLRETYAKKMDEIFNRKTSREKSGIDVTTADLVSEIVNPTSDGQKKIAMLFLKLLETGQELSDFTQATKFDTQNGAAKASIAGDIIKLNKLDEIKTLRSDKRLITFDEKLLGTKFTQGRIMDNDALIKQIYSSPYPMLTAFGVAGVLSTETYIGDIFPFFKGRLRDMFKQFETIKGSTLTEDEMSSIMEEFLNFWMSDIPDFGRNSDTSHLSPTDKRKVYFEFFIDNFYMKKAENKRIRENEFIKRLQVKYVDTTTNQNVNPENVKEEDIKSGRYVRILCMPNIGSFDKDTKQMLSTEWEKLYYSNKNDERKLAVDLLRYSYYRNGLGFAPDSFGHLAPLFRTELPGYMERMAQLQDDENITDELVDRFMEQYLRNHPTSKILGNIKAKDAYPLFKWSEEVTNELLRGKSSVRVTYVSQNKKDPNRRYVNYLPDVFYVGSYLMPGDIKGAEPFALITGKDEMLKQYIKIDNVMYKLNEVNTHSFYEKMNGLGIANETDGAQFLEYDANTSTLLSAFDINDTSAYGQRKNNYKKSYTDFKLLENDMRDDSLLSILFDSKYNQGYEAYNTGNEASTFQKYIDVYTDSIEYAKDNDKTSITYSKTRFKDAQINEDLDTIISNIRKANDTIEGVCNG